MNRNRCTLSALAAVFYLGFSVTMASAAEWMAYTNLNTARDSFAAGVIGDNLYVFGGNGDPDGFNLSSLETCDTATGIWRYGPSNTQGVEEVSGAVVNGHFYVFGAWGGGSPYGVFNFREGFNPATDSWTTLAPKPTTGTFAPTAVYGGEIYVFGGNYENESSSQRTQYSVVEVYNPATDSWRTVTSMPQAMDNFAVAVHQDRAYLIGGFVFDDGQLLPHTDVISYHFTTDTWTTSGLGSLSSVRGFSCSNAAPVVDGKVYLVGGIGLINPSAPITESNAQPVAEVLIYDIASATFAQGQSLPEPRDGHAVLLHDGYLYAIGGYKDWTDNSRTAGVYRFLVDDTDANGDDGEGFYTVASGLSAKAVLLVSTTPVTPVTLVWKQVGTDTTPSGAKVVSGYFYADPADFAYGSQFNPEVFVKVYIDPSGWCNMAFNHVTVDPVTISSAHNYTGAADQTGTVSTVNRLMEHQYTGVSVQ